jgi:hypothetical protein
LEFYKKQVVEKFPEENDEYFNQKMKLNEHGEYCYESESSEDND